MFFTDEDSRVLGGWTWGFDGTEYKGDYGAEITGEEGGTIHRHFDKVSTKISDLWGGRGERGRDLM